MFDIQCQWTTTTMCRIIFHVWDNYSMEILIYLFFVTAQNGSFYPSRAAVLLYIFSLHNNLCTSCIQWTQQAGRDLSSVCRLAAERFAWGNTDDRCSTDDWRKHLSFFVSFFFQRSFRCKRHVFGFEPWTLLIPQSTPLSLPAVCAGVETGS